MSKGDVKDALGCWISLKNCRRLSSAVLEGNPARRVLDVLKNGLDLSLFNDNI